MSYVIPSNCFDEKAADCVDACPVDAIHDAGDQYLIDPDTCIACGACEAMCPVAAIYFVDDVPEEEQEFIEKAVEFYK
jgi:Fe-S-cluster-containing hydrogenase component 2